MREEIAKLTGSAAVSNHDLVKTRNQLRRRFGYYSMFAAVPTLVVSNIPTAHWASAPKAETSVPARNTRFPENLKISRSRALLKGQSAFRLPHQAANFSIQAALGGNDDCPGRSIPGGTYTAAAPFIDSGDTTGANDTISSLYSFYYGSYDTSGPDQIYSFTLTNRGSNPEIKVSATSNTYRPVIYIVADKLNGSCPAGTKHQEWGWSILSYPDSKGVATLDSRFLPLNVPLHLFVDGFVDRLHPDSSSGPYTLQMQDVSIDGPPAVVNAIDGAEFFVRQHYSDFLNREPDAPGLGFWTNEITSCGADAKCVEVKRINASAAFFVSIEFQKTGYLVYKTYAAAFGPTRIGSTVALTRSEFLPDVQRVGKDIVVGSPGWEAQLDSNQTAYFNEFVQRPNFLAVYPATMSNGQFIDALNANAGTILSTTERNELMDELNTSAMTRAQVLRAVVENVQFTHDHFNRAFVLMQYFGYLQRNPNDAPDNNFSGFNFWLAKLDQFGGNFIEAEMVKAFISSTEYRQRFGS